jgi:hypothetical protein
MNFKNKSKKSSFSSTGNMESDDGLEDLRSAQKTLKFKLNAINSEIKTLSKNNKSSFGNVNSQSSEEKYLNSIKPVRLTPDELNSIMSGNTSNFKNIKKSRFGNTSNNLIFWLILIVILVLIYVFRKNLIKIFNLQKININ